MNGRVVRLVTALLLGAALTTHAYRVDDDGNGHALHWKRMPVRYQLVAANAPGGILAEEAVKRAFATWSAASVNVSYVFDGYASSGRNSYDQRNMVYWVYDNWPYDQKTLAVTSRYFSRSDGKLLDADILFNAERYAWSVGGSGYDIENTAAHEVGHFSGLGHSTSSSATMYSGASAGETRKRTLAEDDRQGLNAIYGGVGASGGSGIGGEDGPSSGGVTTTAGVGSGSSGGCSISPTRHGAIGDLAWLGSLIGLLWLRRRATLRDGRERGSRPRSRLVLLLRDAVTRSSPVA